MAAASNGWDEVWAEYDARSGLAPAPAPATHWYMEPDYADTAEQGAPPSRGRPAGTMALASLAVMALVMMLNLRFAPDPAQRLAGSPAPRSVPVLSLASPAMASTSEAPVLLPPPAGEPSFGELAALPPQDWVRPEAIRAAALAAPAPREARGEARRTRPQRLAAAQCAPTRYRLLPHAVRRSGLGQQAPHPHGTALATHTPRGPPPGKARA